MAVGKCPDYWFRWRSHETGRCKKFERARARRARRMVSTGLTLYHQSILKLSEKRHAHIRAAYAAGRAGNPGPRGASEYPASDAAEG